jgi:hypothetical protein
MRTTQWLLGLWLTLGMVGVAQGQVRLLIQEKSNSVIGTSGERSQYRVRPVSSGTSLKLEFEGILLLPQIPDAYEPKLKSVTLRATGRADSNPIDLIANNGKYSQRVTQKFVIADVKDGDVIDLSAELQITVIKDQKNVDQTLNPENSVRLIVDNKAPVFGAPEAGLGVGTSIQVQIPIDEDVDRNCLVPSNFRVVVAGTTTPLTMIGDPYFFEAASRLELNFQGKGAGNYEVCHGLLKDQLGNATQSPTTSAKLDDTFVTYNKLPFLISTGPEPARRGKRIDYPEYVGPEGRPTTYFNPHEKVDSRVIRLYYFRDANRVVQIINRDVQQLNLSRVNYESGLAIDAREKADDATADRRYNEQQAIQVVQQARNARREIDKQEAIITRNRAAKARLKKDQKELDAALNQTTGALPPAPTENLKRQQILEAENLRIQANIEQLTAENSQITDSALRAANARMIDDLKSQKQLNQNEIESIKKQGAFEEGQYRADLLAKQDSINEQLDIVDQTIKSAQVAISNANAELSRAQVEESQNTLKVLTSQDREDRARARQFRQEVIAGTTDRDTYAPGDVKSVDPVQQVSLSVIGEGVIQLRGPSKGINKIARLIHQIDTPVGQVKVGIQTVQINGEHGDRMEYVYERIDKHIAQARFLTSESLQLFRRAVQEVASEMAQQIDEGFIPEDMDEWSSDCARLTGANLRHWRYVNAFFGGDFIRELREMDSELLKHDNKLLSLHSMDTISLAGALYVTAVAKHSVRMLILDRFMGFVQSELPRKEVDYYRALTRIRHADPCVNHILLEHFGQKYDLKDAQRIWEKALRTYQFSNFVGFFDMQLAGEDTLNNVQHSTIRMAQALKAQLVAELEFKNLVLEKSLLERKEGESTRRLEQLESLSRQAELAEENVRGQESRIRNTISTAVGIVLDAIRELAQTQASQEEKSKREDAAESIKTRANAVIDEAAPCTQQKSSRGGKSDQSLTQDGKKKMRENLELLKTAGMTQDQVKDLEDDKLGDLKNIRESVEEKTVIKKKCIEIQIQYFDDLLTKLQSPANQRIASEAVVTLFESCDAAGQDPAIFASNSLRSVFESLHLGMKPGVYQSPVVLRGIQSLKGIDQKRNALVEEVWKELYEETRKRLEDKIRDIAGLKAQAETLYDAGERSRGIQSRINSLEQDIESVKDKVLSGRVLDEAIDETELKAVELLEAYRAHVSNVDNYLKRLAVALEDDVMAQFYNPAMMDVRRASRYWDVTLSQVENTTVLTNNRSFAKVSPTATMELDLPSRQILITEAVRGGKALATEYGNLLKDPTFLAAASISAGRPPLGLNSRQSFLQGIQDPIDGAYGNPRPEFGAALEGLIPDPAVYKFETGTGYEIRPVIQPDGHSIVYTFDYMYTTNVREPVRADEKHLGRVKRHFVHTDVQTSSYEMREVSRYNVALKASRTARGVPLLEDVPGVGALFRPLPNQESSLQQNIIYGTSTIYPTLFDLMGLRWSPYAEDLHSERLAKSKPREREISNRYRSVLLRKARNAVREDIGADFELPAELPSDYREPELEQEMLPNGPRVPATRSRGGMGDDMGSQSAARSRPARTAQRESISPGLPVRSTTPRATGRVPNPREPGSDLDEPSAAGRPQLAPPNRSGAARQRRSDIQLAAATEEAEPPPRRLKKPEEVSPPARPGKSRMATSRPTTVRSAAVENSHAEEVTPAAKPKAWSQWFKK